MNAALRVGSYFRQVAPKRGSITAAGYNFLNTRLFTPQSPATQEITNEELAGGDMTPPLTTGEQPTPVVIAERRNKVFDPTIGWGLILTLIVAFASFCLWLTRGYYDLQQQVLESKQEQIAFQRQYQADAVRLEAQQTLGRSQSAQERADLRSELRVVSEKMDRVLFGEFTRTKR